MFTCIFAHCIYSSTIHFPTFYSHFPSPRTPPSSPFMSHNYIYPTQYFFYRSEKTSLKSNPLQFIYNSLRKFIAFADISLKQKMPLRPKTKRLLPENKVNKKRKQNRQHKNNKKKAPRTRTRPSPDTHNHIRFCYHSILKRNVKFAKKYLSAETERLLPAVIRRRNRRFIMTVSRNYFITARIRRLNSILMIYFHYRSL